MTIASEPLHAANLLQLGVAPDESRQSPCGGSLELRARGSRSRQLVHIDRTEHVLCFSQGAASSSSGVGPPGADLRNRSHTAVIGFHIF